MATKRITRKKLHKHLFKKKYPSHLLYLGLAAFMVPVIVILGMTKQNSLQYAQDQSHGDEGGNSKAYRVVTTITGPNIPPVGKSDPTLADGQWCVDISWYDRDNDRYYLADANNKQVDVVDARTNQLLNPIGVGDFTGVGGCASFDFSRFGPAGVMTDDMGQLWVGNGNSTVHVYNANSGSPIATVTIPGGVNRSDEMAYDPTRKMVMITNPNETPAFVTFIDARTHQAAGQIKFTSSTPGGSVPEDSLEQPIYNSRTNKFYMSVRTSDGNPGGEIAVISPFTKSVERVMSVSDCGPSGMALNPERQEVALGCDTAGAIFDLRSGKIETRFPQITGVDEMWYNPSERRYYFGSFGLPAMGVADGENHKYITNVTLTDPGFHGKKKKP